jgi:hypothetical protein
MAACSGTTSENRPLLVSHEEQGDPRLVAEALSEGLNVCYALADAGSITTPDPQWGSALDSFANALEAVQRGRLRTDMQVGPEDVDRARQLSALVKQWNDTGRRDEHVAKLAFSLFSAFNP